MPSKNKVKPKHHKFVHWKDCLAKEFKRNSAQNTTRKEDPCSKCSMFKPLDCIHLCSVADFGRAEMYVFLETWQQRISTYFDSNHRLIREVAFIGVIGEYCLSKLHKPCRHGDDIGKMIRGLVATSMYHNITR